MMSHRFSALSQRAMNGITRVILCQLLSFFLPFSELSWLLPEFYKIIYKIYSLNNAIKCIGSVFAKMDYRVLEICTSKQVCILFHYVVGSEHFFESRFIECKWFPERKMKKQSFYKRFRVNLFEIYLISSSVCYVCFSLCVWIESVWLVIIVMVTKCRFRTTKKSSFFIFSCFS